LNIKEQGYPVIIYDGECRFCHWFIDVVLKYEKEPLHRFAWLQSDSVKELLAKEGVASTMDSFILFKDEQFFEKSKAAFKVIQDLSYPIKAIHILSYLPLSFTDRCYDLIASWRKKILGSTSCALPIGNESRFLS